MKKPHKTLILLSKGSLNAPPFWKGVLLTLFRKDFLPDAVFGRDFLPDAVFGRDFLPDAVFGRDFLPDAVFGRDFLPDALVFLPLFTPEELLEGVFCFKATSAADDSSLNVFFCDDAGVLVLKDFLLVAFLTNSEGCPLFLADDV